MTGGVSRMKPSCAFPSPPLRGGVRGGALAAAASAKASIHPAEEPHTRPLPEKTGSGA
jgi:hypothetical protein